MKFIFKILAGFLLLFLIVMGYLFILGTADLRTEVAKNSPNEKKAKLLLQDMAIAHGIANWDSIQTYSAQFEEQFYGPIGTMSHPYSEDTVQFLLNYIPNTYDGSLQFLTGGRTGITWGIQSWKSYVINPTKGLKFRKSQEIKFWLPTYQYFIEFPMRIQNANALAYAGEKEIDGQLCEGIIASWNTTEPQREIDQYLIWLDKTSKRIVKLEYTIREMYNFLTGAAYFKDYKNYEGILLPAKLPVESNLVKDEFLHEMQILDFIKNPIPQRQLRPNRALPELGDAK